jgi:hypothetical protein
MSTSDFTATLRQLKLALEKGTPVNLRMNAAGSRLTELPPRTQPHGLSRYCSGLKYAQLDQPTKTNYLHWRAQALQAEQAVVDLDALPEPFDLQAFLGFKPKLKPDKGPCPHTAATAHACSRLMYCIQRLPPFDGMRQLYLADDGRNLLRHSARWEHKLSAKSTNASFEPYSPPPQPTQVNYDSLVAHRQFLSQLARRATTATWFATTVGSSTDRKPTPSSSFRKTTRHVVSWNVAVVR